MLRNHFMFVCCCVGFFLSAASLVTITSSPVLATNCTEDCGPPSNACSGASSGCSGDCTGYSGSTFTPTGAAVNGKTAGHSAPTTTNVPCQTVTPCTNVPINAYCFFGGCFSSNDFMAICFTQGLGTPSTRTYPDCNAGACNEG